MPERRRDRKGRVLKKGESQRKDLVYQYRYTDLQGMRRTIYDADLKKLREKEDEIQKDAENGIDYYDGCFTTPFWRRVMTNFDELRILFNER